MAQHIGNQRIGVPARKPPPKPPKNSAPPGIRGPVGVKTKAPIDVFFHAVHGGKPPGVKGPVGVKAPKQPKLPPVGPRGAQGALPGVKPPPLPKPQKHAPLPTGTVANNKHLVNLNKGNRPGQTFGSALDTLSRNVIGPNITNLAEGKTSHVSPVWLPVEAAGLIPGIGKLGRLGEAAAEGGRALRAGETIAEAGKTAGGIVKRGKLPADRIIHVGPDYHIRAPASPQAHIRAVQKLLDKNVERVVARGTKAGQHPLESLGDKGIGSALKSPTAGLARKRVERLTERVGFYETKGAEAGPRALQDAKHTDPQWMALRQMARGVHPNVTIKANLERIAEAQAAGQTARVAALKRENSLLQASRHYIEGSGTKIALRNNGDKASQKLQATWAELNRVGAESERGQIQRGELTAAGAETRKNMPGELDLARAGYEGFADHKGNLYYPSAPEVKKFSPRGSWKNAGQRIPFKPRGESKQPFTGALQEAGAESHKIGKLVGQQAASRTSRELATSRIEQLRGAAIKGELPQTSKDLEKTYRAILLQPTHDSAVAMRYNTLLANLDKKVNITPAEAEAAGKSLQAMRDELMPELHEVLKEGNLPKEYGLVHRSLLGALEDPKLFKTNNISDIHRALMGVSTLAKDMVVYSKIGHIPPRLISNTLAVLPDTGVDFLRAVKVMPALKKQHPDLVAWLHNAMGGGYYKSVTETTHAPGRFVRGVNKAVVSPVERFADRAPRNLGLLAFAIKDSGAKDVNGLAKYLDELRSAKPGTEAMAARTRILTHARQAAIEYERVGRDASLGNWLFLYRWLKASTVWTARFVAKHPLMAGALGAATYKYGYNAANPIYNRFVVGGHNYTTSVPWSTPPEIAERVGRAGQGKFPPFGAGLQDMIHPGVNALAEGLFHVDLNRGEKIKGNSLVYAGKEFAKQVPAINTFTGKGSLKSRLEKELIGNFAPTIASKSKPPVPTAAELGGGGTIQSGTLGGGGTLRSGTLSTTPGSITKAQHARIMQHLHAAQRKRH